MFFFFHLAATINPKSTLTKLNLILSFHLKCIAVNKTIQRQLQ